MQKLIPTFIFLLFSPMTSAEVTVDKTEELNGVYLQSGKEESVRVYVGTVVRKLPFSLDFVKAGITNFSEKCNNDFKDKRSFTSKDVDCKYHNENLVETFVVKDIKKASFFEKSSEYYVVGRQVYNRGSFGYYELATIKDAVNDKNQKVSTISLKMLNDSEVKKFISPKFSKESAFDSSTSIYTLTELGPNETLLKYEYSADTDHWILNKEISVPQVFAAISKSINDLVKTVEVESSLQHKRKLASQD